MASNETVAGIIAEVRTINPFNEYADRIESAHNRELAAKDAEIAELRRRLNIAEDALKKIDNMCDGDMCKHFEKTHHCSACRYLDECQTGVAHSALYEIRGKRTKIYTPQVKKAEQGVQI